MSAKSLNNHLARRMSKMPSMLRSSPAQRMPSGDAWCSYVHMKTSSQRDLTTTFPASFMLARQIDSIRLGGRIRFKKVMQIPLDYLMQSRKLIGFSSVPLKQKKERRSTKRPAHCLFPQGENSRWSEAHPHLGREDGREEHHGSGTFRSPNQRKRLCWLDTR